jgi:hypothetical protein
LSKVLPAFFIVPEKTERRWRNEMHQRRGLFPRQFAAVFSAIRVSFSKAPVLQE